MKVVEVRSYLLTSPIETPFYFSQPGMVTHRSTVLVEVVTDDGVSGFGEALCHGLQPPQIARAAIDHLLADLLIGRDLQDVVVFWTLANNRLRDFGRQGAPQAALSAVDVALWDALGKTYGRPVYELLGGAFRRSVQPYATGFYRSTEMTTGNLVEEAVRYSAGGFTAMKVKVGFGVEDDLSVLAAIRDRLGSHVTLMADANHAYDVGSARRLLRGCDEIGVHWLEEPISPDDVDGYVELRQLGTNTLVAAGESEAGPAGVWLWAQRRSVDVFQPDLAFTGGFTAMQRISAIAHAAGIIVNPHVWGTAVGLAASLQAIASLPPTPPSRGAVEPLLEYDSSTHPFRTNLVLETIQAENGTVTIPDRPGIGITVDRQFLETHAQ